METVTTAGLARTCAKLMPELLTDLYRLEA